MKKILLMTSALLALTVGLASAGSGGLNLGWIDCGGTVASLNRTFACNSNTSSNTHMLVGSFKASSYMVSVTGMSCVVDLQSTGGTLPLWWNLQTGGCRGSASISPSFDFTSGVLFPTCYDYWQGGAVGGASYTLSGGNRARYRLQTALPAGDSRITSIPEGTEVYAWRATINNAKSTGLTACPGCGTGVCIVHNSMLVTQTPGIPEGNKYIENPADRNYCTWQGGIGIDCYGATPARKASWGLIKSMYR